MPKSSCAADFDMDRIGRIGQALKALIEEMVAIFPEREELFEVSKYAVATREHVLITGRTGTGKSDLIQTFIECITGAVLFKLQFNPFTTEVNLYGNPDLKVAQETGQIYHRPESGVLPAHFVDFDEYLNGNEPVLLSANAYLNERLFKRGHQVERAELLTAFASTNVDPAVAVRQNPRLEPVIDRFIFRVPVDYLTTPESRRRMYQKFLKGAKPTTTIPLEDIRYFSGMVVSANQIVDPVLVEVFDEAVQAFRIGMAQTDKTYVLSDRTACKLLQLVEANAALEGRYGAEIGDILAIRWGLTHGRPERHKVFDETVVPLIQGALSKAGQPSVDELALKLLSKIEAAVPPVDPNCSIIDLVHTRRQLNGLLEEADALQSQLDSTRARRDEVVAVVETRLLEVNKLIDGEKVA